VVQAQGSAYEADGDARSLLLGLARSLPLGLARSLLLGLLRSLLGAALVPLVPVEPPPHAARRPATTSINVSVSFRI
jgi:hypothetical protein